MPFEGAFSPVHILIVAVVALLVLGPDKLPEAARTAAKAWREVQRFRAELDGHVRDLVDEAVPAEFRRGSNPRGPTVTEVPASPPVGEEAPPGPTGDADPPVDDPPGRELPPT